MKKIFKISSTLILFLAVIPLLAGWVTTLLWNSILTAACGFAEIGLWQGVGIFILGQILSVGFVIGSFFVFGSLHRITSHHGGEIGRHWHNMTEEERREFIERRAKFGFHHHHQPSGDATK